MKSRRHAGLVDVGQDFAELLVMLAAPACNRSRIGDDTRQNGDARVGKKIWERQTGKASRRAASLRTRSAMGSVMELAWSCRRGLVEVRGNGELLVHHLLLVAGR